MIESKLAEITAHNAHQLTQRSQSGKGYIDDIAYSPDGRLFAVATNSWIYLYEIQTALEVRLIKTGLDLLRPFPVGARLVFSPDGSLLAAPSLFEGVVQVWSVADGCLLHTLETGRTSGVREIVFSSDGSSLALVDFDNTAQVWCLANQSLLQTRQGKPKQEIIKIKYTHDGETLLAVVIQFISENGKRYKKVHLYDLLNEKSLVEIGKFSNWEFFAEFSPDASKMVLFYPDIQAGKQAIQVRQVPDGSLIWQAHAEQQLTGLAFTGAGTLLASGRRDGKLCLWDASSGRLLCRLTGHLGAVRYLAFSPDGKTLSSVGQKDGNIQIWDVATGQARERWSQHAPYSSNLRFSSDSQTLYSAFFGALYQWHLPDGQVQRCLDVHSDSASNVAYSPDETLLAWGTMDGRVLLRQVADGQIVQAMTGHDDRVGHVDFSPDGNLLASGGWDGMICLWRVSDGQLLARQKAYSETEEPSGLSVAFSPTEPCLVTAAGNRIIRRWQISNGQLECTLEWRSFFMPADVVFSPDGQIVAVQECYHDEMGLWRVSDGELQCVVGIRGGSTLWSLAFSPSGEILATGSADNVIRCWRVSDGKCLVSLRGLARDLAFSPDGKLLASDSDGMIYLWSCPKKLGLLL